MSDQHNLQRMLDRGLVAILRAPSGEGLAAAARALLEGGIDVVEVTLTVPGALDVLAEIRKDLGDRILLGAGSILDPESARAALLAGAEFIVAPTVSLPVIELCRRYGKLVLPGAFTPTEVLAAWQAGADIVKVFPAEVGGPAYLKALHGPLPQVRLMPTGGVNLETMADFMKAGACAVGLGSALVEPRAVREGDRDRIRSLAERYVERMQEIRNDGVPPSGGSAGREAG